MYAADAFDIVNKLQTQADAGLDAIIVNSVKLIAQTLRQDQKK